MRRRRIAVVSILGAMLIAGSLFVAAGSALATSSPRASCSVQNDDYWPSWVQGQPAGIDPHTTSSIYMWHDSGGWHIRVTHKGSNLKSFSGQLTTSGSFVDAHAVHLEKSDQFQISKDKHAITFLFKNYGAIDGVNFHTRCAPSIKFAFQSDGHTPPASKIVAGRSAAHPTANPFEVFRVQTPTTTTTPSGCSAITDDPFPAWVQGRPAGIDPHTTSSIYMWHDTNGWHIRVTHKGSNLTSFSGQLFTSGNFTGAHAVGLEKSDQFQVSNDRHAITFLFKNYGSIDGVDFHTRCAPSIKFALQSDGHTSPVSKIVIGNAGSPPLGNPFEIFRVASSTTTTSTSTSTTSSTTTTTESTTTTSTTTSTTTTTTAPMG